MIKANKSTLSKISLYGACMAVHNGFDNRPSLQVKFQGMVIFQPVSPCPSIFWFGGSIIYSKENWLGC